MRTPPYHYRHARPPTLNEAAIPAGPTSRRRDLDADERLAIYYFHQKKVPVKVIARTFGVTISSIYYIVSADTAAHNHTKRRYELMDGVLATPAQINSINEGLALLAEGKELDDCGYRRNARAQRSPRRAGAIPGVREGVGD